MDYRELATKRSITYKLFSILVSYPYDEDIKLMIERLEALQKILESLKDYGYRSYSSDIIKLKNLFSSELKELSRDYFQAEYTSVFDLGIPEPPCPPYEYNYIKKYESIVEYQDTYMDYEVLHLNRLLDLYRKYNVESDWSVERPDYIGVELEFMMHLCYLEGDKWSGEGVKEVLDDELKMISGHLKIFISSLYNCISSKSKLKSYVKLYEILYSFIKEDYKIMLKIKNSL